MSSIISATGLHKSFGTTQAVEGVDLAIPEREIFGLVGPDGAGKTTTFRMLIGLMKPDGGEVRIGGFDPKREAQQARALVGYVAQQFSLYGELTVAENIRFIAEVRNMDRGEFAERSRELLDLCELAPFVDRLASNLSGGMKRKLALLCALLTRPRILLLDEPTTGIDPVSRREFWRLLYSMPAEGVTLLVSTPYLDEAERCHRLGFMAGGRLLAVDTPAGLRQRMPDALVEIRTDACREARRLLRQRPEVHRVETVGSALRVSFDRKTVARLDEGRAFRGWLESLGVAIQSCEPVAPALADVFSALSDAAGGQP